MPGLTRLLLVPFISCLFLLAPEMAVRADVAPPPPMFKRVTNVEVIAVGQIIGFQDQDVPALTFPRTNKKIPYRIAIVQVTESLKGMPQAKTIRVGFPAPPNLFKHGLQFQQAQTGMFFLKKHFQESFFVAPGWYDFINSNNNPTFPKNVTEVKEIVALEGDTLAVLKSSDAEKRLLAAAILVAKYRQPPQQQPAKQVPINPAESKLILQALIGADWVKPRNYQDVSPLGVFAQLGVGQADGFQAPTVNVTPQGYANVVQEWLRNNAGTYQLKRFIPGDAK